MILVKNWHFCQSMFFLSKRQNRLFDYVLDRKDRFLDYKNVLFTWSKNFHFFKGVNLTGGHFACACVHLLNGNSVGASNLMAGNRKIA